MHRNQFYAGLSSSLKEIDHHLLGNVKGIKSQPQVHAPVSIGTSLRELFQLLDEPFRQQFPVK